MSNENLIHCVLSKIIYYNKFLERFVTLNALHNEVVVSHIKYYIIHNKISIKYSLINNVYCVSLATLLLWIMK